MEFCFLYRLTLTDRVNPPQRHQELSDAIREWFKCNGVRYGMGALGGSRTIYGTVGGDSEAQLSQIREQFAAWLSQRPVCASIGLGPTKRSEAMNLMDDDWDRLFNVDNLTEQDRNDALAYHTELLPWAERTAKKPATDG
jgi:hypothetical protein